MRKQRYLQKTAKLTWPNARVENPKHDQPKWTYLNFGSGMLENAILGGAVSRT